MEFFTAQIRNPHTRAAYAAAVTRFFTWCDARGIALAELSPIAVATYIDEMHGRRVHDQAAPGRHPSAVRLAVERSRNLAIRGARQRSELAAHSFAIPAMTSDAIPAVRERNIGQVNPENRFATGFLGQKLGDF